MMIRLVFCIRFLNNHNVMYCCKNNDNNDDEHINYKLLEITLLNLT